MEHSTSGAFEVSLSLISGSPVQNIVLSTTYQIVWLSARIFQCFLAVITNVTTITVLATFPNLRTSVVHVFIWSLSISDALYGMSFGLHNIIKIEYLLGHSHVYMGIYSRILTTVSSVASGSSLMCTALIAIDRTIATIDPLKYKTRMTRKLATGLVCAIWLYLTILGLSFGIMQYFAIPLNVRSMIIMSSKQLYPAAVYRYFLMPQNMMLLLTTTLLYWKIFSAVQTQKRKVSPATWRVDRMTRMILVLLTVLLCAWLPSSFFILLRVPDQSQNPSGYFIYITMYNILILVHSVSHFANAFVYGGQHKDFRRAYSAILHCSKDTVQTIHLTQTGNLT